MTHVIGDSPSRSQPAYNIGGAKSAAYVICRNNFYIYLYFLLVFTVPSPVFRS